METPNRKKRASKKMTDAASNKKIKRPHVFLSDYLLPTVYQLDSNIFTICIKCKSSVYLSYPSLNPHVNRHFAINFDANTSNAIVFRRRRRKKYDNFLRDEIDVRAASYPCNKSFDL